MADRFLVDAMLGKLATYLRMCGYDAAYALDEDAEADDDLLEVAARGDRTVLTRDRQLAARAPQSILLESRDVEAQLRELAGAGLDLKLAAEPVRCGDCNGSLDAVAATEPTPEYAPDAAEEDVRRCSACGQHFWRGSHWDDVAETIDRID